MPPASGGFVVENFCISAASGRSPIPPCSPSRLVALSRCPDASVSLPVSGSRRQWHEGDQRVITGRDGREQGLRALSYPQCCASRVKPCLQYSPAWPQRLPALLKRPSRPDPPGSQVAAESACCWVTQGRPSMGK